MSEIQPVSNNDKWVIDGIPIDAIDGAFCGTVGITDGDAGSLVLDADFVMVVKGHIYEFNGKINKRNGDSSRKVKLEVQEAHVVTSPAARSKLMVDYGFDDAGPLYDAGSDVKPPTKDIDSGTGEIEDE